MSANSYCPDHYPSAEEQMEEVWRGERESVIIPGSPVMEFDWQMVRKIPDENVPSIGFGTMWGAFVEKKWEGGMGTLPLIEGCAYDRNAYPAYRPREEWKPWLAEVE